MRVVDSDQTELQSSIVTSLTLHNLTLSALYRVFSGRRVYKFMKSSPDTSGSIILASASPRRHELLEQAGISFQSKVSGCDETPVPGESAREMVERLALVKAQAVAAYYPDSFVNWCRHHRLH
jgi:hypothetical protein